MSQSLSNPTVTGSLNFGNLVSLAADNSSSQTAFKDTLQTVPGQSQDRNIVFRATNLTTNAHNLEFDNFSGVHMPRNLHVGGAVAIAKNVDNKGQSHDMLDLNKGAMKVRFVIDRNGATQTGNRVRFEVDNDQYKEDQLPLPIAFGGNKQPDTMTINTWRNEVLVNGQLSATGVNSTAHHTLRQTFQNKAGADMMEAFSIHSGGSDAATQRLSFESAKFGQSMELQHGAKGATLHWEPQGLKEDHSLVRMGAQQFDLGFRKQGADEVLNLDLPAIPSTGAAGSGGSRMFQISTGGTPAVVVRPRPGSADGHEVEVRGKLTAKQVVAESVNFTGNLTMDNARQIHFKQGQDTTILAQNGKKMDFVAPHGTFSLGGPTANERRAELHGTDLLFRDGENFTRVRQQGSTMTMGNANGKTAIVVSDKDIQIWANNSRALATDGIDVTLGLPEVLTADGKLMHNGSNTSVAGNRVTVAATKGDLMMSGKNAELRGSDNTNIHAGQHIGLNAPGDLHVNVNGNGFFNSARNFFHGRTAIGGHGTLNYNDDPKASGVLMAAFARKAPSLTIAEDAPIIFQSSQPYVPGANRAVVLRSGMIDRPYYDQFGQKEIGLTRLHGSDNSRQRCVANAHNNNNRDPNSKTYLEVEGVDEDKVGGLQMYVDENLEFNIIGMANPNQARLLPGGGGKFVNPAAYQLAKFRMDAGPCGWQPTAHFSRVMASGLQTYSDRRLKQNIEDIDDDDVEKLEELEAVRYNPRDKPQETKFGFVAQDVEKLYPHLVTTGDKGMKAVDYTQFIPLLAKANNRLREELEETKARIQKLEKGNML